MESFTFSPLIDLPLLAIVLAGFMINFSVWSKSRDDEIPVDLRSRLPRALFRVVMLFAAVLLICWICNIAVWAVFAVYFGVLVASATLATGDAAANGLVEFSISIIREWAFGFPQLILHPPTHEPTDVGIDYSGCEGVVVSSLRPCGEVRIQQEVISVVSEGGQWIEMGTQVVVIGKRNGRFCVSAVDKKSSNQAPSDF